VLKRIRKSQNLKNILVNVDIQAMRLLTHCLKFVNNENVKEKEGGQT
jgi:hypothetical protein